MNLANGVKTAGVVGAGGGGFPTHVKLSARAEYVIANGAECEPLLHKDAAMMEHFAAEVVRGIELSAAAVGAKHAVIGIKEKKQAAMAAIREACRGTTVRVHPLDDYYPAGDEYDLVYEVTGRLIPPAGIPPDVGVVVCNVETFANISAAERGHPVTSKTLTLAGAVRQPTTFTVPLGTSFRDCLEQGGGATIENPVLFVGGLMMGEITADLNLPVIKTTAGIVVLPRTHPVAQRKLKPPSQQNAIGKSACDQCRYCTEYCPRFLLGYAVEPHQVMRSLAFTATGADYWNQWASLCCACGLCTLYACPEDLYPKEACDQAKETMRQAGVDRPGPAEVKPHPMRDGRQVPIPTLMRKLNIERYDHAAAYTATTVEPLQVRLPLKQNAGAPSRPAVRSGDRVKAGQPVGNAPDKSLGAMIHAPFDATVTEANDNHVILTR